MVIIEQSHKKMSQEMFKIKQLGFQGGQVKTDVPIGC